MPTSSYTLGRIRSMSGTLSASERRVATTILERPYEFLDWSTGDLARESGSSGTTVVRTSRRLGFSGLRDLRMTLARDLGWPASATRPASARRQNPPIQQLFEDASRSFAQMVPRESTGDFKRAVDSIVGARRVLVVATGPSTVFAQDFVYHARIGGLDAEFCPDVIMQAVAASKLTPADVCLAVSASGLNALTIEAVETALEHDANVVVVTGYRHSRLAELASVAVITNNLDYTTKSQAAINSAGLLLMMRGLILGAVSSAIERGDGSATDLDDSIEVINRFSYRRPASLERGPG
jgi:RpiR family carbohydrate utilization transcriptional regulator